MVVTSVDPSADVECFIEDDLSSRRRLGEISADDGHCPLLVAVDVHVIQLDVPHR